MTEPLVCIISAGRPQAAEWMEAWCDGLEPLWLVGREQIPDYRSFGARDVMEGGSLCDARNRALDIAQAHNRPCVQLSDDLRALGAAHGPKRADVWPLKLPEVIEILGNALAETGAQLAGCAPTANPFYSRQKINQTGFIVGDLILTAAGCPIRFDTALRLKEDYDYTLAHLTEYGRVARVDYLLADFLHRRNRGGAVAYRSAEMEQNAIAYLKGKWPGQLRDNPRRPNEVLLKWRPPDEKSA
jgi:hypothetical protein